MLTHLRNRFRTAKSTGIQFGISRQTVLNRLRKMADPITARQPYVGHIIRPRNRNLRLLWAQRHLRWTRSQWPRVLFTDGSCFNLSFVDGRIRLFCLQGECFTNNCLLERCRFGGGSVMVWGRIMGGRKTDLIVIPGILNAQRYITEVFCPVVIPFLNQNPGILMHGNARPHTARLTQNYLARHNVNVLQWPACSPDMNPIEHIWDVLGRRTRENHVINNINDLRAAIIQEWNTIPYEVRHYVWSMRSGMIAVIRKRGGHTWY